jgi:hypothetical protein
MTMMNGEKRRRPLCRQRENSPEMILTGTSSEPGKEILVFRPGELSSLSRIMAEEYEEPDRTPRNPYRISKNPQEFSQGSGDCPLSS